MPAKRVGRVAHPPGPNRVALSASILAAAQCVQGVLAGRSLSDCLATIEVALRPSAQAISFHVMRRLGFARAVQARLVARPPGDKLVNSLLLVALALLDAAIKGEREQADGSAPARGTPVYAVHTVVDQAVNALPRTSQRYRGLLNGTLRNFIRQHDALQAYVANNDEAVWNYPHWWISAVRNAWPGMARYLARRQCARPLVLRKPAPDNDHDVINV